MVDDLPRGRHRIVFVQFGAQAPTLDEANTAISELIPLIQQGELPTVFDRGQFVDAYGYAHATLMVYWFAPESYARWAAQPAVEEFWSSRPTSGPVGYYRETAVIPRDHIETLYPPPRPQGLRHSGHRPARGGRSHQGA